MESFAIMYASIIVVSRPDRILKCSVQNPELMKQIAEFAHVGGSDFALEERAYPPGAFKRAEVVGKDAAVLAEVVAGLEFRRFLPAAHHDIEARLDHLRDGPIRRWERAPAGICEQDVELPDLCGLSAARLGAFRTKPGGIRVQQAPYSTMSGPIFIN